VNLGVSLCTSTYVGAERAFHSEPTIDIASIFVTSLGSIYRGSEDAVHLSDPECEYSATRDAD